MIVSAQGARNDSLLSLLDKTSEARKRADLLVELSSSSYDYDIYQGFDFANRALREARSSGYGEGTRASLTLVGFYYSELGDYRKALGFYHEASRVAASEDHNLGYNYVMMANVYRTISAYDSADIFYQKAIPLLKRPGGERRLAYAYRSMGRMAARQWKMEESQKYFNDALNIYNTLSNEFGKADVYFAMAEMNISRARYIPAEEEIARGCEIAEKLNDDFLKLHCLMSRGEIQFRMGEFLPSLETLLKALELLKQRESPHALARLYGGLGAVYEKLGQNDVALRYLLEAIKIATRLNLKYELAKLQSDVAWIYMNQRNFDAAFDLIDRSYKIRSEIKDVYGVSNCYNVRSIIYWKQKKYTESINLLHEALRLRESINHTEGVAACLYNLGLVYEEQKQYEKALEFQFRALKLEKEVGNKFSIGIAYNSVGNVFSFLHKFDSAEHYLKKAEEIARQSGSLESQMENSFYWSQYYELKGNDKEALKWHKRYAKLNDSVYYESSATKLAEMQALYQADQKDKEIQLLNQEKQLQRNELQLKDAKIDLQGFVIIFVIVAFVLVSLLAYKSYRYNKEIRNAHSEIVDQKEEIQTQAAELQKAYHLIADSHKELEAKVAERTSALTEAYKELDTFFYRASHDFRRPLTTFLGLVEVANITVKDPSAVELFTKVEETAIYLDKMLFKLQSISDLGSQQLEYEEVEIPSMFNEIIDSFKPQIHEKNIRVHTSCVMSLPFYSYRALIHMVVENLVENSISFCRYEDAVINLRATQSNDSMVIEVEDNGDGIDVKYHDRIFEMYFRGNERSKGNGLGLYIVRKAMEKLGGNLKFVSSRDNGTLFRLTFPLASESLHLNA